MTAIADLVDQRHILICCGTGGVGKTTTAATLAIEGARRGRDSVVVTIDPAKRLANTLGLEHLSNSPHEIPRDIWDPERDATPGGHLHALMLDTETTFDQLILTYALDDEQAQRILENRFYRNIAGALSGTQEYMAMEKLYELHDRGGFDLIVVDTPPTRHALDFLDAPRRLTRMLDNRVFRFLMVPTRTTLRVGTVAAQAFLRTISRVVGTEPVDDVVAFFRAFEGMEEGFRDRAAEVMQLLAADETAFVLITSPRRDAVEEAEYFARTARRRGVRGRRARGQPGARPVLRRRRRTCCGHARVELGAEPGDAAARLALRYENLAEFEDVAGRERRELAGLEERIGDASVAHVPELGHDVHDFTALRAVADHLLAAAETRGRDRRPPPVTALPTASVRRMSTIVVAADARWVRDLVKSSCTGPGQEVLEVTRGQDVRTVVGEHSPDLVILDMQIANMGGLAVTIDLRLESSAGRIPDVSILLLLDREADRFLAKRVDADAELVKPVDPGTLRRTVDRLLAREPESTVG